MIRVYVLILTTDDGPDKFLATLDRNRLTKLLESSDWLMDLDDDVGSKKSALAKLEKFVKNPTAVYANLCGNPWDFGVQVNSIPLE